MPASGLIALIDDVAAIADDVATLTLTAAKKSTGLVTDDMAVTAEQALGFAREREIPVVLKVAKGSIINKTLILAPAALLLNAVAPWIIHPILLLGGLYLSFEGVEKLMHAFGWGHHDDHPETHEDVDVKASKGTKDLVAFENERVSGAIRTDLILSAEIVALTLAGVANEPFIVQVSVLYAVCIIITIGVFGIVGGLVKIDDLGVWMASKGGAVKPVGLFIVRAAPILLKVIAWVGTVAMLMVGGHIIMTGISPWYEWVHHTTERIASPVGAYFAGAGFDILTGVVTGIVMVGIMATGALQKVWSVRPWKKDDATHAA